MKHNTRIVNGWLRLCALIVLGVSRTWGGEGHPLEPVRFPRIAIALMDEAPVVDGEVREREWAAAAKLPPLIRRTEGTVDPDETKVFMGYTAERLYIGWQVYRSTDVPLRLNVRRPGYHEGREVFFDDVIELFIQLNPDDTEMVSFAGNAAGAYGDGWAPIRGATDFVKTWDWDYEARETAFGWEAELSIAFADLGLDGAPEPGTRWRFDLTRNNKTPHQNVSSLSYRERGRNPEEFATISFHEDIPVFRARQAGVIGYESMGLIGELVNPSAKDQAPRVAYAVYQLRPEAGALRFFEEVDSGLVEVDTGDDDIASFADVYDQIRGLLPLFEFLGGGRETVPVAAATRQGLNLTAGPVAAGEFLITYQVADTDGDLLVAATLPVTRWDPVRVQTIPYYLHRNLLDVRVTFHTVQLQEEVAYVELALVRDGGTLLTETFPAAAVGDGVPLPVDLIGEEEVYYVHVRGRDAGGQPIAEAVAEQYRPAAPAWTRSEYGLSDFVPPPWTPVTVDGHAVEVWGRTYEMGDSFLPVAVTSRGKELFTAPPRIRLQVDGAPVEVSGRLELAETSEQSARFDWEGMAGGLPMRATVQIDFDGFMTVDLDLDAAGRTVDEFWVEFPLPAPVAELYRLGPALNHPAVPRERIRGDIRAAGAIDDGLTTGFNHALWVGSADLGWEWCAESAEHWHNQAHARALEVVRDDSGDMVFRLRVIDVPVEADRLSYRWGFVASPVREFKGGHQGIRFIQHPFAPQRGLDDLHRRLDTAEHLEANWIGFHAQWNQDFAHGQPFREKDDAEDIRNLARLVRDRGFNISYYTGWNALHPVMRDWPFYGEAMRRVPTRFGQGGYKECTYGGYIEYLTAGAVWMIENIHADGVFLDSTPSPAPCLNPHHGCGYVEPATGVRIPTYDIWGRRELMKRLYKIFNGEVMEGGLIYGHGTGMLGIAAFSTIRHAGEGMNMEEYATLDYYRAEYCPYAFGIPVEHSWRRNLPVPRNLAWGVSRLHGTRKKIYPNFGSAPHLWRDTYEPDSGIDWRMWVTDQWFDWDADPEWHMYHRNQHLLTIDDPDVYASFFINRRGQVVLNAVNLAKDPTVATMRLNVSELGLAARLHARDVITHAVFDIEEGRFDLDFHGHRPRMLMIDKEPIPKLGPLGL